jgi:capsular polysaccharide biosynthesis protein
MRSRLAPLILVLALAFVVVGTTYLYAHNQPDVYTSRAVLSLSPRDPGKVGADNLQLASARYTAYLASASTMEQVATDIGEPLQQVVDFTEVRVQPNTVNIEIVVTMRDGSRAAAIVNALAAAGLGQGRADPLVTVDLMVPGMIAKAPSGPNRRLIMIGGVGVALLMAGLAVAALGYFQNSASLGWTAPLRVARRADAHDLKAPTRS